MYFSSTYIRIFFGVCLYIFIYIPHLGCVVFHLACVCWYMWVYAHTFVCLCACWRERQEKENETAKHGGEGGERERARARASERARERRQSERERGQTRERVCARMCVCVCLWERVITGEKEREPERAPQTKRTHARMSVRHLKTKIEHDSIQWLRVCTHSNNSLCIKRTNKIESVIRQQLDTCN